jgi:hypothetical protein
MGIPSIETHSREERLVPSDSGSLDPARQEYSNLAVQVSLAFCVVEGWLRSHRFLQKNGLCSVPEIYATSESEMLT